MSRRPSIVVDRLRPWINRDIAIRVAWQPNEIIGYLAAVYPVGTQYMIEIDEGKGYPGRLINVSAVLSLRATKPEDVS